MSSLLQLPRELRDRIYRNLLSVTHTKTPKSAHDGCRSAASRYNWNIYPTILRVNRQIHDEARELMALDNDFVVIERAAEGLREVESDTEEEDVEVMKFDVRMWPGRPSNRVNVPGERIRISLRKDETDGGDIYVLLVEELRDFCIGLSTIGHKNGSHGLLDIHASVSFEEALSVENREVGQAREDALFNSLIKLRFLASLKVECAASERVRSIEVQVVRQSFDKYLITSTIDELVASGDHARDIHHFDVAFAYYQRASDYFHHFVKAGDHSIFIHPADPLAIEFKIMQHRALNWVEDDNFEDALRAAELALHIANQLFAIDAPTIGGPETDAQGRLKKDRQRIKCEDIGRCYFYKSISERFVFGEATEEAEEDKLIAIGCCVVSDTATDEENIPKELMELDMRTMKRFMVQDREESDEEDKWEDESEDDK